MLKTSFRSLIHATDSTCIGWIANSIAAAADFQTLPVNSRKTKYASTELIRCMSTLTACDAPGFKPKICMSAISDSHINGCQFAASKVVKAHFNDAAFSPESTA